MSFCKYCKQNNEEAHFCKECGKPIGKGSRLERQAAESASQPRKPIPKNALPMGRHCRSADLIDCRI